MTLKDKFLKRYVTGEEMPTEVIINGEPATEIFNWFNSEFYSLLNDLIEKLKGKRKPKLEGHSNCCNQCLEVYDFNIGLDTAINEIKKLID